jgi:AcrR family transcriptional regulator
VPPEQAKQRLIEATIELLRTTDPYNVTVRDVASTAGLNLVHITRYFGSRAELLFAVTEELHRRLVTRARTEVLDEPLRVFGFEEIPMRLGLMMALRSEGFDMTRFRASEQEIFAEFAGFLVRTRRLDPDVAEIQAFKVLLLLQALNLMGDAHGMPADKIAKMVVLARNEMDHADESARRLGWL